MSYSRRWFRPWGGPGGGGGARRPPPPGAAAWLGAPPPPARRVPSAIVPDAPTTFKHPERTSHAHSQAIRSAQLAESGNAQIGSAKNPVSIVVDTMSMTGNAIVDGSSSSSSSGSAAAVALASILVPAADGGSGLTPDGTGGSGAAIDGVGGRIAGLAGTEPTGAVVDPTAIRLPMKIKVTDALGNNVSAWSLPVVSTTATGSAGTWVPQAGTGGAQPGDLFSFDPMTGTYRFKLKANGPGVGS